ncbi:hypothetical protein OG559_20445 [Micromonospora sp. NBC_01405]|uniref:hypothetical protein n=1 Tax=Micromonospora sp. NBC_01405 TaxID=2903589 RepID=UPI003243DC0B
MARLSGQLDDPAGQAHADCSIAWLYSRQGQHRRGLVHALRALELFESVGRRPSDAGQGPQHGRLAVRPAAAGDLDAAGRSWLRALDILDALGHSDAERVRVKLRRFPQPPRPLGPASPNHLDAGSSTAP